MVSISQIRDLIRVYLSGALSLQRFAEAFEDMYSAINVACDEHVLVFGDQIEALLSRVSSGLAREADLRSWLESLSQPFSPSVGESIQYDTPLVTTYNQDDGYLITA